MKPNDKVKVKKGMKNRHEGLEGKILCILNNEEKSVGVEFKEKIEKGHDCIERGKTGHCYFFKTSDLVPADQNE